MNNKQLGTKFEQDMCKILTDNEYWVHFITPDARGAQPFDIIAVKHCVPYAIECKTLTYSRRYFTIDRLEDNQILAFERWRRCGNNSPIIAVKQANSIITFTYDILSEAKRIDMEKMRNTDYIMVDTEEEKLSIHGVLKHLIAGDKAW